MRFPWLCPNPNGWWPTLSPDARWAAYGNQAAFLTDLSTHAEIRIPLQHPRGVSNWPHGWLSADEVLCSEIYDEPGEPRLLYAVTVPGLTVRPIPYDPEMAAGHQVRADRGHIATWYTQGRVSYDGALLASGRGGVVLFGEWAVTTDPARGYAFEVYRAGQLERTVPNPGANVMAVCDGYLAVGNPGVWVNSPTGETVPMTVAPWAPEGDPVLVRDTAGGLWLWTYAWFGGRGTFYGRPILDGQNRLVATQDVIVWEESDCPLAPSIRATADGWVMAGHNDIGRMKVWTVPADSLRVVAVRPPDPPVVAPTVPVIGRPCWFGYYKQFNTQYGANPSAPCTFTMVETPDQLAELPVPAVVTPDCVAAADVSKVVGVYANGGGGPDLEANAAATRAALSASWAHIPIWGCYDGGPGMPPGDIPAVDVLGLECYVGATETAADCERRVRAYLSTLPADRRVYLVGQSYTSNTGLTSDLQTLMDAQVIPAAIARDCPNVVGILMFSDGRPTGTRDHEQWRPVHRAILAGIPGTPPMPAKPTPPAVPPVVVPPMAPPSSPKKPTGVAKWFQWD